MNPRRLAFLLNIVIALAALLLFAGCQAGRSDSPKVDLAAKPPKQERQEWWYARSYASWRSNHDAMVEALDIETVAHDKARSTTVNAAGFRESYQSAFGDLEIMAQGLKQMPDRLAVLQQGQAEYQSIAEEFEKRPQSPRPLINRLNEVLRKLSPVLDPQVVQPEYTARQPGTRTAQTTQEERGADTQKTVRDKRTVDMDLSRDKKPGPPSGKSFNDSRSGFNR